MNQVSRLRKLFLKIILCLAVFVVSYLVTMGGPKVFFAPDALVIYRYQVENNSGESVTCAKIGWFPRVFPVSTAAVFLCRQSESMA